MPKPLQWIGIAGLAVLGVAALAALALARRGGEFGALQPHFAGTCLTLPLEASAAHVRIDRGRGLAYLTYLDPHGAGTIVLLDPTADQPRPRAALNNDPPGFRPQGLALLAPAGAAARLFVITDSAGTRGGSEVEILEQGATGSFRPLEAIETPGPGAAVAVLAMGAREFYVVNDPAAGSTRLNLAGRLLGRGRASVDWYDGKSMHRVLGRLAGGAGIAASPDGGHVYVSEPLAHRVSVYARDAASAALQPERSIAIAGEPADLDVDEGGNLWIAAHPRALTLLRHLRDAGVPAPTRVFRVSPRDWNPVEVYLERGERLSAGNVAAAYGHTLLLGAIAEHRLLRCTLP